MYNLIYINTHDTGRMISPYGYNIPTDNLLSLAKDSTLFTNCYCCGPTCSPSRAAMLTGTYPHQNGMLGLAQRGFGLYDPSKHLASYLKSKGYHTAISGIQHETGWYLDLDNNALHDLGYEDILTTSSKEYKKEDLHIWDHNNVLEAINWINNYHDDKPFMLSYGMHSTHRPYPIEVDKTIDERYVNVNFASDNNEETRHDKACFMTSAKHADENVGLLLEAIRNNNLLDNTIIMFTTDHGVADPFHKCTLNDRGIGVSLIIRHPKLAHGIVCDNLVSHIDVFPTLCDLLEIDKPDYLEGISFNKMFENEKIKTRDEIYAEVNFHTSYEPIRCIRTNRYKYIKYYDTYDKLNLSNIDESICKTQLLDKGLREYHKPLEALYDLLYDKDETNNLINDPSLYHIKEELSNRLYQHMLDTNDPILLGELKIYPNYKVNKKECLKASSKDPNDYDNRGRTA